MNASPGLHHRRSIRLPDFDYTQDGAYFVTLCTQDREYLFGVIEGGEMVLNDFGVIVREEWEKSAAIRAEIELGEFVVMPNHVHAIVIIRDACSRTRRDDRPVAPTTNPAAATNHGPTTPKGPAPKSIGA
jgi:hypothetical protein